MRLPGESLDRQIDEAINESALLYFVFGVCMLVWLGLETWLHFQPERPNLGVIAAVALPLVAYSWFRSWRVLKRVRLLEQGRDGERIVAEILTQLRASGYIAFHDLVDSAGKFNVDHVLVGPAGIFVIETKTWTKPFSNAQIEHIDSETILLAAKPPKQNPIPQARGNARWIAAQLKVFTARDFPVQAVVLFPGWFVKPRDETHEVWVLNGSYFVDRLKRRQEVFDSATVNLIATHLARSSREMPR